MQDYGRELARRLVATQRAYDRARLADARLGAFEAQVAREDREPGGVKRDEYLELLRDSESVYGSYAELRAGTQ